MIEPLLSDDAFLDDVQAHRGPTDSRLHLWWLGQSGYLISYRGHVLGIDLYLSDSLTRKYEKTEKPHVRMSRRVVDPEMLKFVHNVLSTHNHTDHLDAETLHALTHRERYSATYVFEDPATIWVATANEPFARDRLGEAEGHSYVRELDVWTPTEVDHWEVTAVPAAHPELSLDEFSQHLFVGYIIRRGDFTIYHSGDTVVYESMADDLRRFAPIDVAILPINGKIGNMNGTDAARLAKAIGAKIVVPCHYHMFEFNTAEPAELFVPECERFGQPYRVLRLGERLTIAR